MLRRTIIGIISLAAFGVLAASTQKAASPSADSVEAARLNNLGVAYMNQQLFERALKSFQAAAALDPDLQVAALNQGVALLNLTHIDQAKALLEAAAKKNPADPHVWFSLGLLYKNSDNPQGSVDAFRHVTEIDPNDADTWYFLGAAYAQTRQYPQAIDAFQHALKLNPLHASGEFGIARAYQQSGDAAQAREHLVRFQHITQNKLGSPIGLAYGDQGRYSLVEESPSAMEKALPAIAVRFVPDAAGLTSKLTTNPGNDLPSFLGPGACFLDYDGDGKPDIFLPDNGPQGGMTLYHNLGGKFEDVTQKAGLDPALHAIGCTAGDYDNDGAADLAVSLKDSVFLLHNEKNGTFKDVTAAAGIKSDGPNLGVTFIDYDHDGDLDLYVTRTLKNAPAPLSGQDIRLPSGLDFPGNAMWRNNGNGTFTNVTQDLEVFLDPSFSAVGTDFNNDRAVDLVVADVKGPSFLENPREGKFQANSLLGSPAPNPSLAISVLDFNHDGWMDVAFTHSAAPGLTLWRNEKGIKFERVSLPETNWARAYGVAAFDYDNDGWIDLIAAGQTSDGKGEVRLFRNLGPDGFKDVTADVGLDKIQLKDPRAVITGDYDGDGATDLLITQNHGPAVLLHNQGGNKNNWLKLSFKGLADNKSAIGTKIEVFAGANRQKFEIAGSSGYLGQSSTDFIVGLGQSKEADVVRMLWPSGVLQDEIQVAGLKEHSFLEMDRRGSSCPTLFAWDGTRYELIGDMLGAGVVGHWVGPNQRDIPRPTEYIKVPRTALREKDGRLSFRFMEPLEEAVYLDQVKLLAVDHPAAVEVFPNEYFASNPPYPPFKVIYSRDARPPVGAWDEHGHNVLPDLLARRYFGDFKLEQFQGFAKSHTLELDLGEPYRGGALWLLMHGEIEYFSATSMFAAYQAGIEAVAPYVEAQDANGKWLRVIDDMGFPAGGPRTMTADLTDKLPRGTQRIRITTNLQIYWDNILVNRASQEQNSRITPVPLARADLRFHGFPLKIENQPPGNVLYVYEKTSPTGPYTRPAGAYTRYGDVRPLLAGYDDQLAVFGSGDEVVLDFDPAKLPALSKGWRRDYFFVANGYEKDMDFYAAEANTVQPLPFRSMGTYPYPRGRSFPLDDAHVNYFLNYNTRHLSGNEPKAYRFDYSH
ncbi:MAG TPA: FG-GAP-like repeat-containing protein [Terriglobales bacterium]|jgi:tetratricopeptide (TPR) repeat protein|nr:FG-GAP-like repeat-containing protein [Terriglobales bacterium]